LFGGCASRAALLLLGACLLLAVWVVNTMANEDVSFEELGGDQCFIFFQLVPQKVEENHYVTLPLQLVINNDEEYRKLFDPKLLLSNCSQANPSTLMPKVDF
jgi:hypothetical protein